MKSYPSYIAGQDAPADKWIHTIRASSLLGDAFGAIRLKRALAAGNEPEPADDRVVGRVALSTTEQCLEALRAARAAQREWAAVPLARRMEFGALFHKKAVARQDEFVEALIAEGHPRRLAEWEVAGVIQGSSPETFAVNARMMDHREHVGDREIRLVRKPDGVVCLSPPQNAAASNSMLGVHALMAGNSLVVKAPRSAPYAVAWAWRELVATSLEEMGAPAGVLSIVCGVPKVLIDQWMTSDDVDDIMYFGGSERGIEIGRRCVEHGKKPVLELAGNDGVLVWEDADLDNAAQAISECFYGSSQICMVPKYVIAHPRIADALVERLRQLVSEILPGKPEEPGILLSPVLRTTEFFTVLDEAVSSGAELLHGGQRIAEDGTPDSSGIFLQPTLVRVDGYEAAEKLRAVRDETFFPLLSIVVPAEEPAQDAFASALRFMNDNPFGLRNSLWSEDPELIEQFCARLDNGGILKINDSHLGFVPGIPTHGGNGLSGGPFGEANYPMLRTSHLQAVSIATKVTPRSRVFESALPPVAEETAR
ncbi:aldehyde dehydrogenase family protein [Streptomyces corynorhini]|uniref:Aldehyde dehydrogenase family protein n=1 Tax=Streptomyces corynorhini TaxID=2282652 RepID=A0A370BCH4_9ACTN|nr:aldehyde dehydrogenase [Streptomyces corynorhini]RDG38089.1 aldehyde dehydrogenase family protein [Streptomyces corynorhini]